MNYLRVVHTITITIITTLSKIQHELRCYGNITVGIIIGTYKSNSKTQVFHLSCISLCKVPS